MYRRGDMDHRHEVILMALGLNEVCMNFRELLTSSFHYGESHVQYAIILRKKLSEMNIFGA